LPKRSGLDLSSVYAYFDYILFATETFDEHRQDIGLEVEITLKVTSADARVVIQQWEIEFVTRSFTELNSFKK